ncbi:MAG TPA: alpha/beta hydrolase [Solirubrobacterales bacterium]|jgi:pimeloyl-ACP methyl ester carboxylesterase
MAQSGVLESSSVERIVDVGHGMTICFRDEGDPSGPPVLMLAGLGQQLNVWPGELLDALGDRGLRVVRLDNRDIGRSGRAGCPPPSPGQMLVRRFRADQYTLGAMAADTLALLDALGIERAHLVGMSMGGMIAQTVAARQPGRVLSLTSIMSTTGARRVGRPALSTWMRMARPPAGSREAAADGVVAMMRHIGSRGYPFDEAAVREVALEAWDRGGGSAADGVGRQLAAIFKSGDRTREVERIEAPTLVVHGDRDPMIHPSGGRVTAAAIRGARLRTFPGMGHDLPGALCPQLSEEISAHVAAA